MMPPANSPFYSAKLAARRVQKKPHKEEKESISVKDSKSDGKSRKSKSSTTRKSKAKHGPTDTPVVADVKATALAAPIPAGDAQTNSSVSTVTIPPTATPVFIDPSVTQSLSTELPPFLRKTTTVWVTPSSVAENALPTHSSDTSASASASGHLPIFVFALIAVGATCLGLGVLLVIRSLCIRHGHSDRPRPSAPILQESPLFGGKERFSGRLWADQSFGNLLGSPSKNGSYAGKNPGWRPLSGGNASELTKVNEKVHHQSAVSPFADPAPKPAIPLSPASVYTQAAPTTIGLAVDYPLPPPPPKSTACKPGTQPLNVKNKPAARANGKGSVKRRSVVDTMYGGIEIESPRMTEPTAIYQTPRPAPSPASAPSKPQPMLKPAGGSRDRVQPPRYDQYSLPTSNPKRRSHAPKDGETFVHAIPMTKSQERRDRDTKALTSALGLGSPPPPSSCFSPVSIYPDDSLSVAYGQYGHHAHAPSEMPSPTGTHAALGDLMLQDFPSVATFASMKPSDRNSFSAEPSTGKSKNPKNSQTKGGPPRVPSPPPMPSLAQMALQNADPDYRSPTYSLYGFYEAQRKSKTSGGAER